MSIRASSQALCIVCLSTIKCMPIRGNKMALSKYFGTRWCCGLERHCTNIITTPDWKDTMRICSGDFIQVISDRLGTVVVIDQVWETVRKPSWMREMLLETQMPCMSEDYFKIVCRHSTFSGSEICRLPCSWTLERKDACKLGNGDWMHNILAGYNNMHALNQT
jgi:hypothetical protein